MSTTTKPRIIIPTVLGTPFEGGNFAGLYIVGQNICALIDGGKAAEHPDTIWNQSAKSVAGAMSFYDGHANTVAMAEAGSKLGTWALGLRIGGKDDWFIPARDEKEMLYRAFKPTKQKNYVYRSGDNPSSVPVGYPYTEDSPAQTVADAYKPGGGDAFDDVLYWTSTQYASDSGYAWYQDFGDGYQGFCHKYGKLRARAVRRLIIQPFNPLIPTEVA